jgi:hypothetical protein
MVRVAAGFPTVASVVGVRGERTRKKKAGSLPEDGRARRVERSIGPEIAAARASVCSL